MVSCDREIVCVKLCSMVILEVVPFVWKTAIIMYANTVVPMVVCTIVASWWCSVSGGVPSSSCGVRWLILYLVAVVDAVEHVGIAPWLCCLFAPVACIASFRF